MNPDSGKQGCCKRAAGLSRVMIGGGVLAALVASRHPLPGMSFGDAGRAWAQSRGGNWALPAEPALLDEKQVNAAVGTRIERMRARREAALAKRQEEIVGTREPEREVPPLPRQPRPLPPGIFDHEP